MRNHDLGLFSLILNFFGIKDDSFQFKITDKKPEELFGSAASCKGIIKVGFDKKTNTVWIFTQNHENKSDLQATIREELLEHEGLGLPKESLFIEVETVTKFV